MSGSLPPRRSPVVAGTSFFPPEPLLPSPVAAGWLCCPPGRREATADFPAESGSGKEIDMKWLGRCRHQTQGLQPVGPARLIII